MPPTPESPLPRSRVGRSPRPVTIVVPVRSFENAKSRLGAVLDAEERHELVERLLRRTIAAGLETPGVAEVLVVSPDPEVLAIAAESGARALHQETRGLNHSLSEAREAADPDGRLLVLPGDLPGVTPAAITAVIEAASRARRPCVGIVPDRHGRGTNALLLDPPDVIDPAFGGDSRAAHAWLAGSAEATLVELGGPLSLDIDTPDDLLATEREMPEAIGVA